MPYHPEFSVVDCLDVASWWLHKQGLGRSVSLSRAQLSKMARQT